jgi:hypothetical protein
MGGRYWVWLVARLVIAMAIVGWAFSYIGTGSAEKEFQKTLDAMRQVRSFRASITASARDTQHNDTLWEVDCNRDLLHFQWHVTDTSTDPPAEIRQDQLFVAGQEYEHQADGSWQKARRYGDFKSAKAYCSYLQQGADSNVLPQVYTMIQRGILQKGDKKTVNGVRCREWLVTMKGGFSSLEHDTICIGLKDYLPYEMTVDWEHSHSYYSDYNTAISFDVPDTSPQPASSSETTN